ncbi:hypothetical protein acsn021_01840 [Anaerocolumna cellulosilytica]|uniref:Uncharacterized protein n=1 Tax=Anaerocolumna cellulosilytica TaxID=433286 RepID=A0A6S6QYX0_9FIRM|nr:AHH domain-containing protein [Anaerocolumna cellulosilytica]MBB5197912.1 hypothetical protein [Anaerocolumna cellulosilytica]BCJ92615.1 hypothetical protein acsn021_01840 [Anaerocolumna cellulosilytica]
MGESMDFSASGGTVTALTLGYEFNLLGSLTTLSGKKYQEFEEIDDALIEKEKPKEEKFSLGKVLGFAAAGLAIVAVAAVTVAYAASVVVSGGATLAAAPSLVPAIMGFGTFAVGSMYVLNKASQDINAKHNSSLNDYIFEAVVGSARGMISTAIFTYMAPATLINVFGAGFISGNLGSAYEQLMRKGCIEPFQALKEGILEGAFASLLYGAGKFIGGIINKLSSAFKKIPKQPSLSTTGNINNSNTRPNQVHHFASNKNSKYTKQFESIVKKYGLKLDEIWNKELMPHQGRHPNAYHDWILEQLQEIDQIANGNKDIFLELFENVKNIVRDNPDMLRKIFWK